MKITKSLATASLALILLAACGSVGDVLGGGSDQDYEIRGTVESVDLNSRSVWLSNVTGYNASMLSNTGGNTVRVYYDEQTPVEYNGQTYRPADLERGDQVAVRVDESGNNLLAESMTVIRDVSNGGAYPTYPSGSYESNIRGTVRSIDTARRTIEVDRGYGSTTFVESRRPPSPTSTTATSTPARAKCSKASAVVASKKVAPRRLIRSAWRSMKSTTWSSEIGVRSTMIRSRKSIR